MPPPTGSFGAPDTGLTALKRGIASGNPIIYHALGVCSALAVTNRLDKTLVMSASLVFVATLSCLAVSLLRERTPRRVRMIAQMLIIATLVILVDLYLKSHWIGMRNALGPYVELIITNCIIMARCEACASRSRPVKAALDGMGTGIGYSLALCAIALLREPIGSGTLLGHPVFGNAFGPARIVALAPGAFLGMGAIVWLVRGLWPELTDEASPVQSGR